MRNRYESVVSLEHVVWKCSQSSLQVVQNAEKGGLTPKGEITFRVGLPGFRIKFYPIQRYGVGMGVCLSYLPLAHSHLHSVLIFGNVLACFGIRLHLKGKKVSFVVDT